MVNEVLVNQCVADATRIFNTGEHGGLSIEQIAEYLYKEEINKQERESFIDSKLIDFNDEIVEIEELDERELMDIQVSGDNLFYANDILTKNSIGLPQSLDWFAALTTNELLQQEDKQLIHLLKTRFGNKKNVRTIPVGVNFDKMKYYDLELPGDVQDPSTVMASVNTPKPITTNSKGQWEV